MLPLRSLQLDYVAAIAMAKYNLLGAARGVADRVVVAVLHRDEAVDQSIGQDRVREQLHVSITAARQRGEHLDHALLYGPPGLGKMRVQQ